MILATGGLKVPKSRFELGAQFISKGQVSQVLQSKDMVEIRKVIFRMQWYNPPSQPSQGYHWRDLEKSLGQTCAEVSQPVPNPENEAFPKIISGLVSALHREVE